MPEGSAPKRRAREEKSRAGGGRRGSGRGRRLTVEEIVDAAIGIADDEGLDRLSIRRLAAELGAPPMTLYGHISNKDELLSLMVEETIGEILLSEPLPEDSWREALAIFARRTYLTMVTHAWFIVAASAGLRHFGPNAAKVSSQWASALLNEGLEPADIWLIIGTVNDYVLGHSMRAVSTPAAEDLEQPISKSEIAEAPELAALPEALRTRAEVERFEAGLEIVLKGVERLYMS